jgi:serine/threonine-protein kinase
VLKQVEDQLARTVGPVAKVMVKRAAQRTTDLEKLYTLISEALPTPEERNTFLANRPKRSSTNPGGTLSATRTTATRTSATRAGGTRTAQTIALTPEAIDEAGRALTPYLGPIAKVVVKRAAAVTQNRQEFYQILADELSTEKDRAGFLRAVGAVI